MKPVEIQITIVSGGKLAVSIDYHTGVSPVVRRWLSDEATVEAISRDLDELVEDALSRPGTEKEAAEQRQDTDERLRSLGLALFQEILRHECDHLKSLVPDEDTYLLFKIDGALAYVPFEMLYDGEEFLSHRFAMARAIYTEDAQAPKDAEKAPPYRVVVLGDPSEDPSISRDVEEEIDAIKGVLKQSKEFSLRIATGSEVDMKFILSALPGSTVFHFSGHGEVSADEGHTGIRLKNGDVLSGMALRGLQDPPTIAFFNMCAAASREAWRGSLGLIETLLRRGTKACVASLWDLRSKSATLLASRLYEYLLRNETFGHALRKARLDVAHAFGTHDPTWAAYTLYGDPQLTLIPSGKASRAIAGRGSRLAAFCALLILVTFILFPTETHRHEPGIQDQVILGYLLLESTPEDATILIDGTEVGMTPFTAEVTVGDHRVTIEKQGYKQWEAWVEVKETPRAVIQAYLEKIE
ncbi:MAG: CHAT domain-containing protein [Candidatus Eisenbacteria bacterium]